MADVVGSLRARPGPKTNAPAGNGGRIREARSKRPGRRLLLLLVLLLAAALPASLAGSSSLAFWAVVGISAADGAAAAAAASAASSSAVTTRGMTIVATVMSSPFVSATDSTPARELHAGDVQRVARLQAR